MENDKKLEEEKKPEVKKSILPVRKGGLTLPGKKIISGANKFAVNSGALSSATNKFSMGAKKIVAPVKAAALSTAEADKAEDAPQSPMKLHINKGPGKISPLMASLNKTSMETDNSKKMSFSFKKKPIGKPKIGKA